MAKKGLTEIVCVIDESCSMKAIEKDAVWGFNKFIKSLKEETGQASVTVALFNTECRYLYFGTDIQKVKRLTKKIYVPSGETALIDAVGKTIDDVGVRLSDTQEEERPEKVIFTILSGSEEKSSRNYTINQVFDKINHQTYVYKWQFAFLGADQDAVKNAGSIGIDAKFAHCYTLSGEGIRNGYEMLNDMISSFRQAGMIKEGWKK